MATQTQILPERSFQSGSMKLLLKWLPLTVGILILAAIAGLWFVNRELPSFIERKLNENVEGYHFSIGQATLSPIMSLEIRQLTMIQIDHPDPPVAEIPLWRLSIQWSQIFSGVLVSDYLISSPDPSHHSAAGEAGIRRGCPDPGKRMARGSLFVLSHQDK